MDAYPKYYDKLNVKQREAVDHIDGPLLVLAGPGTGKTELLSVRAANIIQQKKAKPENILILTFTNAAAKAMKERLVKILGPQAYNIETATFHSFANSIILESEEAADYIQERQLITEVERIKVLEYILNRTQGVDAIRSVKSPYFYRKAIQQKINELKREGINSKDFEEAMAKVKPDGVYIEEKHIPKLKAFATVYKLYEEYKSGKNPDLFDERGRYDFDDMIIIAIEALRSEPELKRAMKEQYAYVMVDEFQDTNGAQLGLLFELVDGKNPDLCCVGDDDQSIYRFQGASSGNFKLLKKRFPATKEISLEKNYRSTKEIITLSEKIISALPEKERVRAKELSPEKDYKKKAIEFHKFTTEPEELLFMTERIRSLKGVPLEEVAVLLRKREHVLAVVDAFLRAGIPYATDGKENIAGEKRVRQMLDVLNFANITDPSVYAAKDAYLYRVLTADYMRIPMADVLAFIASVNSKKRAQKKEGIFGETTLVSEFPKLAEPRFAAARKAIKNLLEDTAAKPVHAILMRYIKEAGMFKFILEKYDKDDLLRIRDLRALTSFINMVKNSDLAQPGMTLSEFMDDIEIKESHNIALEGDLVTATQEGVRIFTAHGSKGMEFNTVFIPFCLQDKNWPMKPRADLLPLPPEIFKGKERVTDKDVLKQLDYYDETRLFYVASTRAKADLIYTASPVDDQKEVTSSYIGRAGIESAGQSPQEEKVMRDFMKVPDSEDPFIGTEKVLKDLVAGLTLNPTSLNNYIDCPRKYLYDDVLMLPGAKNFNLTFGSCVHKALEDTYDHFMKKSKFPDFKFFKESFTRELEGYGVESSIKSLCMIGIEGVNKWFDRESKAPVKPIGLEEKLMATLDDDLVFTGKYDKTEIVSEKEKSVRVVDYKTGKPDDHVKDILKSLEEETGIASDECDGYLRQLISYKLLFERDKRRKKGYKVKKGKLVFVEPAKGTTIYAGLKQGEFRDLDVDLTDEMVAELESAIKDIWRRIKKFEFDKLPERVDDFKKCKGCDFDDICWG
ncbi:MAG: ATP-dependent DNA helicase [Candidatus Omnitrophota bacterium]|nr:ATP-dependent DNA helicase [Candidatus Omnitrophota bacterium]